MPRTLYGCLHLLEVKWQGQHLGVQVGKEVLLRRLHSMRYGRQHDVAVTCQVAGCSGSIQSKDVHTV